MQKRKPCIPWRFLTHLESDGDHNFSLVIDANGDCGPGVCRVFTVAQLVSVLGEEGEGGLLVHGADSLLRYREDKEEVVRAIMEIVMRSGGEVVFTLDEEVKLFKRY